MHLLCNSHVFGTAQNKLKAAWSPTRLYVPSTRDYVGVPTTCQLRALFQPRAAMVLPGRTGRHTSTASRQREKRDGREEKSRRHRQKTRTTAGRGEWCPAFAGKPTSRVSSCSRITALLLLPPPLCRSSTAALGRTEAISSLKAPPFFSPTAHLLSDASTHRLQPGIKDNTPQGSGDS